MPTRVTGARSMLLAAGVPLVLVLWAAVVFAKAATTTMVQPLWTPLLGSQLLVYGLAWLALCIAVAVACRVAGTAFSATLAAAALAVLAAAVGASTFLLVAAVLADAFLIGIAVARPGPDEVPTALPIAIGLGVMALLAGLAELFPVNTRLGFTLATLAIPALLLDARTRRCARAKLAEFGVALRPGTSGRRDLFADAGFALLVGVLGVHLLFVLQPEGYFDALVMHLYVPSYAVAHGRWSFDASTWAFAHFPLTVDFLYTWFFALGGEEATRLYDFASLVLIAGLILSWLRRTTSNGAGMVSALLFVSTPLAFIETASLFIENSLTLWITGAALVATTRWRTMNLAAVRVISVLLAAAMASKLHGVLAVGLIGLVMLLGFARRRPNGREWLGFAACVALCGAVGATPYVYSWIDTGNPVFPFFNQLFRSPLWPPVAFVDHRWTGHLDAALLWSASFHSSAFVEGADGALGASLLIFLPLACVVALLRRATIDKLALFIGVGLFLLVATQIQYLRYFYIAFPTLFFTIGRMFAFTSRRTAGRVAMTAVALLGVGAGLYLAPSSGWALVSADFRADFDPEARRKMVEAQMPERLANSIINEIAGRDARVYYSGAPLAALLEGTALSPSWYNTRYDARLHQVATPDAFGALLREMRVTHVVLRPAPRARPLQAATAAFLQASGHLIATAGVLQIYDVRQSP